MAGEHVDVLLRQQVGQGVGGGAEVEKTPLLGGFLDPGVVIAVAVEDDALVGDDLRLDASRRPGD